MLLRRRDQRLLRLLHSVACCGRKGCTDFASIYVFIVSYCIRFYHVRLLAFLVKDNIETVFLAPVLAGASDLTSLTDQSTRMVGDKAE